MRRPLCLILVLSALLGWAAPVRSEEPSWTTGRKSVLVVRVNFPDDPAEPGTAEEAEACMADVARFFHDNSYGQLLVEPVVTPLLTLPRSWEACAADPGRQTALRDDALAAARVAGFDPDGFDLDIVLNTRLFGPRANIGSRGCWLLAPQADTAIHELGHNLGLRHANLWIGRGDTMIGPGRMLPYGNMLDAMADVLPGTWPDRDFNAAHKHQLHWLPSSHTLVAAQSGVYRLWASDVPTLASNQVYALRVGKDSEREYWLECRRKWASNPQVQNGLLLYFGPWRESYGSACLVDTSPNSHWADDSWDAPLPIGRTFSDTEAGVHITPLNRGSDGEVWMDARIVLGRFPDNLPPVIGLQDGPEAAEPGSSTLWSASAEDPDGDEVLVSWDFGDGTFAAGTNIMAKAWSAPGDYLVRCWVSDMRGGQRCAFRAVRVGQPDPEQTARVSGRVTNQGLPAPGVRLSIHESLAVYTDADGRYLAVGLASGRYQLHPGGAYLAFQPASRFVDLTNAAATDQDFEASWTATPNNPPYVVTRNPGPGSILAAPASIELRAWAYDDGEVSMVEFQDDTGLASLGLGNSFGEVWTNRWPSVSPGEHTISVRATDDFGAVGEAWPTHVMVVADAPVVALESVSVEDGMALRILSAAGQRLLVEASANLMDWTTVATITNQTGRDLWTDPEESLPPTRFYRVRVVP